MNDQPIGAVPLGTLLPAKPAAAARTAAQQQRMYTRFNIHQRLQHFLLVFSFLGLMTTGMPLRFPELAICRMFRPCPVNSNTRSSRSLRQSTGWPAAACLWLVSRATMWMAICSFR